MGWFDNEQAPQDRGDATQPKPRPTAPPTPSPAPSAEQGSTLGRQVHVDGTIVCGEDLTILGRVEGTIRAKGTLVIAEQADVRATIDGQRVVVEGKVDGNVHGAEKVSLGPTARLTGNIDAPALEITDGAYFKGSVEMKVPDERSAEAKKARKDDAGSKEGESDAPARTSGSKSQADSSGGGSSEGGPGGAPGPRKQTPSGPEKTATR